MQRLESPRASRRSVPCESPPKLGRSHAETSLECTAKRIVVCVTDFGCNCGDPVGSVHQEPPRFVQAQLFDKVCRRDPEGGAKFAREVARAEIRAFGHLFDGEIV